MRTVECEACGQKIELTTELMAKAACDIQTRFGCPNCTAVQEITYASGCGLIHATTGTPGKLITFRASGGLQIENSTRLEDK